MAANTSALQSKASPVVVAIAVVAVLALVGWMGYKNLLAPPGPPRPLTAQEQTTIDKFTALAKQSHGDINQLSEQDRDSFMRATGGHGAQILASIAKQNHF